MPDSFVPDQTYTFDGTHYWEGEPMPRDVAEQHGLLDDEEGNGESGAEGDGDAPDGTYLPEDFPRRQHLLTDGYETVEQVDDATDEELNAVHMVGESSVDEIRTAVDEILSA